MAGFTAVMWLLYPIPLSPGRRWKLDGTPVLQAKKKVLIRPTLYQSSGPSPKCTWRKPRSGITHQARGLTNCHSFRMTAWLPSTLSTYLPPLSNKRLYRTWRLPCQTWGVTDRHGFRFTASLSNVALSRLRASVSNTKPRKLPLTGTGSCGPKKLQARGFTARCEIAHRWSQPHCHSFSLGV